jgi:hypothetical protein
MAWIEIDGESVHVSTHRGQPLTTRDRWFVKSVVDLLRKRHERKATEVRVDESADIVSFPEETSERNRGVDE